MKYLELTQGHNILMLTRDFIPHSSYNKDKTVINRVILIMLTTTTTTTII